MSYSYSYSYYHCKSILFGVFVTVIICVAARPAENNAHSVEIPNKSDLVQIWKLTQLDSATNDQGRESFSKKLFYNSTEAKIHQNAPSTSSASLSGLHIPVRVIYEAPVQRYAAKRGSSSNTVRRNSKQRNFPEDANEDQNSIDGSESESSSSKPSKSFELLPNEVLTATPTDSPSSITVNEPRQNTSQVIAASIEDGGNETPPHQLHDHRKGTEEDNGSAVAASTSVILATAPDQTNRTTNEMAEKYIVPILDKLKELTDQNDRPTLAEATWTANGASAGAPSSFANSYPNALQTPPAPSYSPEAQFPSFPFAGLSPPLLSQQQQQAQAQALSSYYYYGLYPPPGVPVDSILRQWGSPFSQYFPIVIRDPFQSILNSFSDFLEYGPAADVCQRKLEMEASALPTFRTARSSDRRSKRNTHKKDNRGKYHYVPPADSGDDLKRKDTSKTKTPQAKHQQGLFGGGSSNNGGVPGELPSNVRGTDVGPQISKLIVRRGGVAIAGAGGIATAGSGGTAIVGPGGTAFTTPASSGGVAMVGPGGKVVKVSDLTDVLYGRTRNANVAATGAGQSTFTTKDGEVFTTSDNTGGVALVNPGGGLFGVSDDDNLQQQLSQQQQQQQRSEAKQPNEMQLPAGARLLTTGPIIYYNPVYPAVSAPVR